MEGPEIRDRIAEVIQHGRPQAAFVLGQKGKRLRVLLPSGKEETVSSGQTLLVSRKTYPRLSRQEILDLLAQSEARRQALAEELDLSEIWELVEGEAESFDPFELAEIYFGSGVEEDQVAALVRAVLADRLYFRLRDGRITVHSREEVERLLLARKREEERLRRLSLGERFLGALVRGESPPEIPEEIRAYYLSALRDYCLFGEEAPKAKEIKEILSRLKATGPETPFRLLVRAGVFEEDENLEILRFRLPVEFPEEVLEEAEGLFPEEIPREDFNGLETFTIDAEDTRDFDDALSLERQEGKLVVGVHITDVASVVPPDSRTLSEARRRGQTLYLPERIIPMLPPVLSEERLSLREGERRPALSFFLHFSPEGKLLRTEIRLTEIRVSRRLTYEEVDQALAEGKEPFFTLHTLARAFQEERRRQGAFAVTLPEVVIRVEEGEIRLERLEFTAARELVAECMIAANYAAARFLHERGIPALYRYQKEPLERILKEGEEADLVRAFQQLRFLVRGELGLSPEFHHGLGLPAYTTVTSPIRRLLDLLMQHQIRAALLGRTPPFSEEALREILVELEEVQAAAAQVRTRTQRYWLLKYLRLHFQGRTLPALVLEAGERRARVLLPDLMLPAELPLPPGHGLRVGEEIRVKVQRVHPRLEVLKLALA
ncbi:RNB domain-containing ribonuclease [Thermosulfurimonas marina]|uniref:RNB domain-containing ribonuclease n=1 Tax=Thermosulfurimonas marina TaxID=2047767 RepID=A0A6H1WRV4_9BACT|nr:ribonuclease catalytic domain-containing protein [Thermosulfurimonas marina]QJA05911.1 RNB domain-containing ribonuclease [Thermosulfurimonas marina]